MKGCRRRGAGWRHSDPKLTLKTYAKTRMHDVGAALEKMATAKSGRPLPVEAKATGTDEQPVSTSAARSAGAARLAAKPVNGCHDGSVVATIGKDEGVSGSSAATGTCGKPGQVPATPVANAEGRTRTANLRVMNPAL